MNYVIKPTPAALLSSDRNATFIRTCMDRSLTVTVAQHPVEHWASPFRPGRPTGHRAIVPPVEPDPATARHPRRLRSHPLDVLGRLLMVLTSRRLDRQRVPWLVGPTSRGNVVGHDWVELLAGELGGRTSVGAEHGLLPSFDALAGATFDPGEVDPRIADFYEHTARWRLDLWSAWSAYAWPFGAAVTALFSQRLRQLTLPMDPLDVSYGMDSTVVHVLDAQGAVAGAAWLRNMRKTGTTTYSGLYGSVTLPGSAQPSVRVAFPLPLGSVQVFLRPSADGRGGFHLHSPLGPFGSDGAYLVLERRHGVMNARRIPIAEHFHLFVDDDGDVRADHSLRLWSIPAVRLHYRMRVDTAVPPHGRPSGWISTAATATDGSGVVDVR
jgi:hypothetical protein